MIQTVSRIPKIDEINKVAFRYGRRTEGTQRKLDVFRIFEDFFVNIVCRVTE